MNPGKSDSAFGVILWGRMVHQSLRPLCFKFESSSSCRTSAGTLIFSKYCVKQDPGRTYSKFSVTS